MMKFKKGARTLLLAMLTLCLLGLIGCAAKAPIILESSRTMRILPGDLPKSPESKGWFLSDEAVAKLLEAAERCNK